LPFLGTWGHSDEHKKIPAFPLVREKEDVLSTNLMSARLKKAVPLVFLGRVAQQQPLFPWFSIAAAQRDRLSNGPTLLDLASISPNRRSRSSAQLLREIAQLPASTRNGTYIHVLLSNHLDATAVAQRAHILIV
jgi:hypothetical protein